MRNSSESYSYQLPSLNKVMKKKLDTNNIMNELRGQSVFFPSNTHEPVQQQEATSPTPLPQEDLQHQEQQNIHDTLIPRYQA
jgi:hypothetical protein